MLKNKKKYHKTIHQQNIEELEKIPQNNLLTNAKKLKEIQQDNSPVKC